jgi:arylsulfatase A-like enzyme
MMRFLLAVGLAAACSGRGDAGRPEQHSVLLVTLDTTRADALSCYGERAGTTPEIDALAREGVLYERAFTSAPITLTAHASMLTGLAPPRHGLRDNGLAALDPAAHTLAEAARAAGIQTAAFVGAIVLDRALGLDQGFDVYDGPPARRSASGHPAERPARAVIDAALAWLDGRDRARPFLLWVHLYDAHHPYAPRRAMPEKSTELER